MARLKSRQKHPPGGFVLLLPEIGMKTPVKGAFNEVVLAFSRLIQSNPSQAEKHGWPAHTDWDALADWVDAHNAARLIALGYTTFVEENASNDPAFYDSAYWDAQKKTPSPASAADRLSAGAAMWRELFGPDGRTVDSALATHRASICASCPQNDTTTSLFNIFVSAIASALGSLFTLLKEKQLTTPHDDRLGVCRACLCPMRAKVFIDVSRIEAHTDERVWNSLDPSCWMLSETGRTRTREKVEVRSQVVAESQGIPQSEVSPVESRQLRKAQDIQA